MSDEIEKIFPRKLITTHSETDLIIKKLRDPENESLVLTAKMQQLLDRMNICKELIGKYTGRDLVCPKLMNMCNISSATAYKLYTQTIEVFDSLVEMKGRNIWIDILLSRISETRNKALVQNDMKAVVAADKLFKETIKDFFGDHDADLYRNIQPPDITFQYNPKTLGIVEQRQLDKEIAAFYVSKNDTSQFDEAEIISEENGTAGED